MHLYEDLAEINIGILAIGSSSFSIIAQTEALPSWAQLIPHFGGLAFAVWLVIHHTTVTMPNILKDHKAERLEMLAMFNKHQTEANAEFHRVLEEKTITYKQLLEAQTKQFADMLREVQQKE